MTVIKGVVVADAVDANCALATLSRETQAVQHAVDLNQYNNFVTATCLL